MAACQGLQVERKGSEHEEILGVMKMPYFHFGGGSGTVCFCKDSFLDLLCKLYLNCPNF